MNMASAAPPALHGRLAAILNHPKGALDALCGGAYFEALLIGTGLFAGSDVPDHLVLKPYFEETLSGGSTRQ